MNPQLENTWQNSTIKLRKLIAARWFILENQALLEEFPTSLYEDGIDADRLTHAQAQQVMKRLKCGRWEKTPGLNGAIDYVGHVGEVRIRLWAAEAPPNCKVVEEEVLVPAVAEHLEKRFKLVCKDEPAAIVETVI